MKIPILDGFRIKIDSNPAIFFMGLHPFTSNAESPTKIFTHAIGFTFAVLYYRIARRSALRIFGIPVPGNSDPDGYQKGKADHKAKGGFVQGKR